MATPLNLTGITGLSAEREDVCTIEASCVTGFEAVAAEEVKAVLGCEAVTQRGRVVFDMAVEDVKLVTGLRCVNTAWVMLGHVSHMDYPSTEQAQMECLTSFVQDNLDWKKGLKVWREFTDFQGEMYPGREERVEEEDPERKQMKMSPLSFRCTCYRTGNNHKFKSTEVQAAVGGRVHDMFHWAVSCKNYNLEFVINCDVVQVYCCLTLTNKSLYHRTVTELGPCTLRPTIAAGLVMLAQPCPGDVILDPMCGGGTISLEGCQMGDQFHIGAEIHDMAVSRCRENYSQLVRRNSLPARPAADFLQWDCLLPCLRDGSVDVLVTDLPFGKRSGSKADNRVLYPQMLTRLARLVRPDTGRAVLLTQDKNSMIKSIKKVEKYWKSTKFISTNVGGLTALVFLFRRTSSIPCDS